MLNFPQDSSPNNLEIRSFADHLDQQLNLVAADASSCYPFPPTIFCPDGLHDLLVFPTSSSPDVIINNTSTAAATTTTPPAQPDLLPHSDRGAAMAAASTETSFPRARVSRKDRHSKIFTASGPRDRRMRLSIDVARNFFQLQDMLGFDKASKTVQWLLSMSKAAIKDLAAASSSSAKHCCTCSSHLSPNSTESSTISGSKNKQHSTSTVTASGAFVQVRKLTTTTTTTKRKKGSTNYNKPSMNKADNYLHSALARESRAKARERARERTKEKQRLTSLTLSNSIPFDHDVKQESTAFGDLKSVLELGDDRANCGYPSDLFPVYGNTSNQQGAVGDQAGGGIYQEQWDLEAISFYSRIGMSIIFETNGLDSLLQETKERKPH